MRLYDIPTAVLVIVLLLVMAVTAETSIRIGQRTAGRERTTSIRRWQQQPRR